MLRHGTDEQLGFVHEFEPLELERLDARLVIRAEENLKALAGVDPTRLARQRAARRDLLNRLLERKGRGELRTCLTRFPTDSAAQEAGMSLGEYEDFVFNACLLDRPDPVQAWQDLSTGQQRYVDFLDTVGRVRIEGDGTELELSVAGRKWVNSDGRANFPSGEVFTGPVEDSAEGRISFDVPAVYGGRAVEGISLEFRGAMVVSARAKRGDEVLQALLGTDAGARRLGEFAFGLNHNISRATGDILFDEKIGGTIHLALGTAYPETGSLNRSAIHWDMMKDMRKGGRVLADGRPVYENGRFLT
ncbi:aminopeptidase [candidate division WOR-3 bacterium]|nr:aminopeptidase [candidate division WOR-3 bacterium]